jgi:phosphoribosylformylglycinamidine synthase
MLEGWLKAMKPRILIIRVAGTNCDSETARALEEAGASAQIIHTRRLINRLVDLSSFHGLVIPGGFSYGDYVRAGAIWASKLYSKLMDEIVSFANSGKPIFGICNGFQVLVEMGLLPGLDEFGLRRVSLAPNDSSKFECRWVYLKPNSDNRVFMRYYTPDKVIRMPVAHSEGKFIASNDVLKTLMERGLILLQYAMPNGSLANGVYPFNPNGSYMDIAGICNVNGNVMGLMPHPERATYLWQYPDFASKIYGDVESVHGDGYWIFKSMCDYIIEEIV